MKKEEWKTIKDFPNYQVSNMGRIRSIDRIDSRGYYQKGKLLRPYKRLKDGYLKINLYNKNTIHTKYVHRIVLETFKCNTINNMECCHNNGNRSDNKIKNLRWGTHKENSLDVIKHGTQYYPSGSKHGMSKLTESQVLKIREKYNKENTNKKILAKEYGVSYTTIREIVNKHLWKHI